MEHCRISWCSSTGRSCPGTGGASTISPSRAMALLVPGLLALVFGWFAFRSRVSGVYLSIITQALTFALMLAFFRNDMGFGGNNGMTDFKDLLGFPLRRRGLGSRSTWPPSQGWRSVSCSAASSSRSKLGVLGAARCRGPRPLPGLFGDRRQALRLHPVGDDRRAGRRALRAAGRHHQSERILAGQLDRDRHLGGGRWPRHADRRADRRGRVNFAKTWLTGACPKSGCSSSARCSSP